MGRREKKKIAGILLGDQRNKDPDFLFNLVLLPLMKHIPESNLKWKRVPFYFTTLNGHLKLGDIKQTQSTNLNQLFSKLKVSCAGDL